MITAWGLIIGVYAGGALREATLHRGSLKAVKRCGLPVWTGVVAIVARIIAWPYCLYARAAKRSCDAIEYEMVLTAIRDEVVDNPREWARRVLRRRQPYVHDEMRVPGRRNDDG